MKLLSQLAINLLLVLTCLGDTFRSDSYSSYSKSLRYKVDVKIKGSLSQLELFDGLESQISWELDEIPDEVHVFEKSKRIICLYREKTFPPNGEVLEVFDFFGKSLSSCRLEDFYSKKEVRKLRRSAATIFWKDRVVQVNGGILIYVNLGQDADVFSRFDLEEKKVSRVSLVEKGKAKGAVREK